MNMQPPKKEAEKMDERFEKNLYTRETQHYGNLG